MQEVMPSWYEWGIREVQESLGMRQRWYHRSDHPDSHLCNIKIELTYLNWYELHRDGLFKDVVIYRNMYMHLCIPKLVRKSLPSLFPIYLYTYKHINVLHVLLPLDILWWRSSHFRFHSWKWHLRPAFNKGDGWNLLSLTASTLILICLSHLTITYTLLPPDIRAPWKEWVCKYYHRYRISPYLCL